MKENQWKVGDNVRVIKSESTYYYKRGQITHVNNPIFSRDRYYTVLLNTGISVRVKSTSLELPSIKVFYLKYKLKLLYEDIQTGSI